jgi:hypothetical protein
VRSMVLVLMLAATPLYAQESRGAISAIGGFGKTWDDEGSLGSGWLAGGAVDRTIFGNKAGGTRLELSAEVLSHNRNAGYFLSEGQTVVGAFSLVQRFGSGGTQPYVAGGLTLGHHSGTNTFNGERVPLSVTNGGFRGAFGVAFRAGQRMEISPEFRLNGFFVDSDPEPVTILSFGIRVGWRM